MSADCLVFDIVVKHPMSTLWKVVGVPELYPRFFRGITELRVHRIQTVISRPPTQLVFRGVPDTGRWVSLRLHDDGPGRTRITLVFFKRLRWSDAEIMAWAKDGFQRISDYLSRVPGPVISNGKDFMSSQWQVARTLMRAGVLAPTRPDRAVRQLRALAHWGGTLAGGYTAAAIRSPDTVAIIDEHGERTFAELAQRSTRLANGLRRLGVGADSRLGVLARNNSGMVESLLAASKLGAHVVLLNTGLSAQQVHDLVRRHAITLLLADDEFQPLTCYLPAGVRQLSTCRADSGVPTIADVLEPAPTTPIAPPARPGRVIVLTSGTTGMPKGARRPTPKGLTEAASFLSRIPLRVGERMHVAAPMFHSWGFAALQIGMPLRATLVLRTKFDAEDCLRTIAEQRCTVLFAVPVMLQRILNLPRDVRESFDLSSLRIVASSGSAMAGSLVTGFLDAFGDVLYNFYGSTEVSWATVADPADLRAAPTTAGRPPLGTRVGLFGATGEPAPPGTVGRIFVGNDMLFDGYTEGESKTMRDSMMDTGDRGYFDADGRLFVIGRDDEMIISGGENVFPRPVEEVLAALPQVEDVAVIGVPDAEFGQRLAAYVVLRAGARLDADTVRNYVHQRLARFSVPRDVIFVPELPRNQTGKVLKRLLAEDRLV